MYLLQDKSDISSVGYDGNYIVTSGAYAFFQAERDIGHFALSEKRMEKADCLLSLTKARKRA